MSINNKIKQDLYKKVINIPDFINSTEENDRYRFGLISNILRILSLCINDDILQPEELLDLDLNIISCIDLITMSYEYNNNKMLIVFNYILEVYECFLKLCIDNELFESAHNLSEIRSLNVN